MIRASVIIPTRGRGSQLAACLGCLVDQGGAPPFEVVVVFDGADEAGERVASSFAGRLGVRAVTAERLGIAHAKNVGIESARGELLIFVNDDVLPEPEFIARHAAAHGAGGVARGGGMVVGHSPWVVRAGESVFDRLLRTTSMVFFYDRMIDEVGRALAPADHDWGFRHAWNLNLSVRRAWALEVGGFRPAIANCCYEDVEFAWRVVRRYGAGVLFEPRARAPHDHTYTPEGYLDREWRLGYSAYGFAAAAGACARELFGRDLLSEEELRYAAGFVDRESRAETALIQGFLGLASFPAAALAGVWERAILEVMYGQHLLLKRLAFRRGLLAAARGERSEGLFLPEDGLETGAPLRAAKAVSCEKTG